MASPNASSSALAKRPSSDNALMPPPPPPKRIKRPAKVLDEEEYTSALSQIIARDFFPGLEVTKSQQEYLNALESNNPAWIAEAGRRLTEVMTPVPADRRRRRSTRNSRFETPVMVTPRREGLGSSSLSSAETPKDWTGNTAATPSTVTGSEYSTTTAAAPDDRIDTSNLSLSAFQAKYTSEDNESFNALLDEQNQKRREKNAFLWAQDGKIPTARQIAYRAREARLLTEKAAAEIAAASDGKELVPITTGATESRPSKPDAWQSKNPASTFMFTASSVDEEDLETVAEAKEAISKAGPKRVVYGNTRFTPESQDEPSSVPSSPALSAIIARRAARSETEYSGGETPRVNGYAFVDEDEPENIPATENLPGGPTYRDLLAGQTGDATPNPFKLKDMRAREDLHHRLVAKQAAQNRAKAAETIKLTSTPITPLPDGGNGGRTPLRENLTPAAKKLLDKMGKTSVASAGGGVGTRSTSRMTASKMWTPTPKRKGVAAAISEEGKKR